MEPMFTDEAIPYLLRCNWKKGSHHISGSEVLRDWGSGARTPYSTDFGKTDESDSRTRWQQQMPLRYELLQKPTTTDEANELIDPVEEEIRSIVGEFIYGTDDDTLSSKAAELLNRKWLDSSSSGKFNSWSVHGGIGQ